jgi:hypothetical protein
MEGQTVFKYFKQQLLIKLKKTDKKTYLFFHWLKDNPQHSQILPVIAPNIITKMVICFMMCFSHKNIIVIQFTSQFVIKSGTISANALLHV